MTWRPQDGGYHVNLVACGYFPGLETRLREFLKGEENVGAVGRDPFALWVPVLTELWKVLDDVVWGVLTVFAGVEAVGGILPRPRERLLRWIENTPAVGGGERRGLRDRFPDAA